MCKRRYLSRLLPFAVALLLGGCTTTTTLVSDARTPTESRQEARGSCGERYGGEVGVQLAMIRQQLDDERPRAALAYLDTYGFDYPDAKLLRAEALRRIDERALADRVYEELRRTCLAADAYRGLALNAANRGVLDEALSLMQQARDRRPADARIRNDLGYLLLLGGDHPGARRQFLTALELDEGQRNAATNLVLSLMQEGRPDEAQRMARRYGVDGALLAQLRQMETND
ncbi:hypothetical protein [Halomonas salifodinae]|uniref:hypothetical protein n=1 Tax=Halomonas salifodinae TaxID=438745 RepID=UPI0033B4AEEE